MGITDLTSPRNVGGDFAFLSACKTATGGVTNLDEVITIAAAMQYAGWRHVIGTLWTIHDRSAAAVSQQVYRALVSNGVLDPDRAPFALHDSIREVRRFRPDCPSLWAQFIHVGA